MIVLNLIAALWLAQIAWFAVHVVIPSIGERLAQRRWIALHPGMALSRRKVS